MVKQTKITAKAETKENKIVDPVAPVNSPTEPIVEEKKEEDNATDPIDPVKVEIEGDPTPPASGEESAKKDEENPSDKPSNEDENPSEDSEAISEIENQEDMSKKDINLERIELLHPSLRHEAKEIYEEICSRLTGKAEVRFTQTLRTIEEQNALYALGRTKKGAIVTNAKGGESYHNYGLAIDICLILNDKEASWDDKTDFDKDGIADWSEVVSIFKRHGWEWGGDWKFSDKPHFQKTFGKSIKWLRNAFAPDGYPQIY